ncbi:hypothetical protein AAVH_21539 [Aphelenchoides avenae]|nr:hypothetical protein AAVH_21539 [Aphelenchus avenae]
MRAVFKRCLYQLPREHVEAAWLRRDGVEYERKRPFTGHWYDQTLVEGHWRSRYRVKGHPLTLKRYAVDTLHLEFSNRYFGVPDLNHFDVVSPEFLSYVSNARAQHIVLSGFAGDCRPWHGFNYPPWHHMAEIIDKAKYCASQVEYVQCVCFLLDGIDQFETVLENVREFPRTVENLRISLAWAPGGTSPIPAARLNPKRKGISEPRVLPHGVVSGYEVAQIIERNSSNLRRITLDGQIYVDIELNLRVVDVSSAVERFFKDEADDSEC